MDDTEKYNQLQQKKFESWEAKCSRCGACCGSTEGDPCENLRHEDGHYTCAIYEDRFGMRRTVSGKSFRCVPIEYILSIRWPGDECCGYKNIKRGLS